MGAVYEAWQEDLRRLVAVKVISGQKPDDESVARFQREARAAAALGHPYIVQIYDFQMPVGEPPFLVMELLPGPLLSDVIAQGPLPPERVARIARHVLDALGAAHGAGVVHRDVKPANIALVPSSTLGEIAKVLDFGVAKLAESTTGPLSSVGLIGTIAFMAPEQAAGLEVDGRADVFSLAVCMYVACAHHKPFESPNADEALRALLSGTYQRLAHARPDLDPWFVSIVERGMMTDRNLRYPSAQAMAAELDGWLTQRASQTPMTPPRFSSGIPPYAPPPMPAAAHAPAGAQPAQAWATIPPGPAPSAPRPARRRGGAIALVLGLLAGAMLAAGGAALVYFTRPDLFRAREATPTAPPAPTSSR